MGLSVPQLLIILAIVLLLFGAKRLRTLGTDMGAAVKGFKNAVREDETEEGASKLDTDDADKSAQSSVSSDEQNKV